jgi:hypothetical protein
MHFDKRRIMRDFTNFSSEFEKLTKAKLQNIKTGEPKLSCTDKISPKVSDNINSSLDLGTVEMMFKPLSNDGCSGMLSF